ncbi:MAG: hypothetical protein IT507_06840 [Burkholderiaceae bacterium]|nr:hypothetical protein [Burkholderiaceae bacterium]
MASGSILLDLAFAAVVNYEGFALLLSTATRRFVRPLRVKSTKPPIQQRHDMAPDYPGTAGGTQIGYDAHGTQDF